ncbi:MAG TPA: EI24 domain-containing protein [Planctomycetota bacterium]|nr:EI24 domain-containing protein [Planctomycetota bacterium]
MNASGAWGSPPVEALRALGRGAAFALRDPHARPLLLLPGLLTAAGSLAFYALAAPGFDSLARPLLARVLAAADAVGLAPAAWTALAGLYFASAAVACLAAASLLAGTLLERIGTRADEEVVGSLPFVPPRSSRERLASLAAGFPGAWRSGAAAFALAPLALLPLAGPALLVGAAAWSVGRCALERSMERRGLAPEERLGVLRENRAAVLLFGLGALAAATVPIAGGFLGLPAAHAGAPFLLERLAPCGEEEPDSL